MKSVTTSYCDFEKPVTKMIRLLSLVAAVAAAGLAFAVGENSGMGRGAGRADWLRGSVGVSVHWTADIPAADGSKVPFSEAVDRFDVTAFADALASVGAKHLIFTTAHGLQVMPMPNAALDAIAPGRTTRRDLFGEILDACAARGIRVIAYYNHSCNMPSPAVDEWKRACACPYPGPGGDSRVFASNICAIVRCMSARYGRKISGWWFDSSYSVDSRGPYTGVDGVWHDRDKNPYTGPEVTFPWDDLIAAARQGNPDAAVAINAGVARTYQCSADTDYYAGETAELDEEPDGPLPAGLVDTRWTTADDPNWTFSAKRGFLPLRRTQAELRAWTLKHLAAGRAVTFNVLIDRNGRLNPAFAALKDVLGDGCVGARKEMKAVRKVVNVVNFVRALDPRMPKAEYVRALDEEVKLNRKYGFKNTVLLQYDALVDAEMLATARKSDPAKTEFGFWFEMSRPLNEAAGLPWKPTAKHKDWNWDWFINPGFLMAYDHDGRRRLVDAAFAKFRELFGHYPTSVGSWLLDAYSMDYMVEKYGVNGFCICREQDNTDAYGLRGGYSNGAYYPSKRNMLSAAVDMKNAVRSPVFKMLTPDPIHNYGNPDRLYSDYPYKTGCATLEPVWNTGFEPRIVDWFFRVYTEPKGLVNLSYMQAGQENSFGWRNISKGWPMQCAKIAAEAAAGRLVVETMGETARRFKADHPANCPQTQVALEDWNGNRRKSIWYNSRFYRANLILDGGRLVFRDIHKMADDFEEPFLDKVCTGWQALYFTPPVVDQWLFRDKGVSGTLAFDGAFASLAAEPTPTDGLVVTAVRPTGERVTVRFDEGRIAVKGTGLSAEYARAFREKMSIGADALGFGFSGYRYRVPVTGELTATERGFRLTGEEVVLDLAETCL